MILQALQGYYQRKVADDGALPPFGFETKGIEFMLLLDREGQLINIEDVREVEGKKKLAREYLVPQGVKKTSGIAANLLWDNAEYVLGLVQKGKPERTAQAHATFAERIRCELGELEDDGVRAVLNFLDQLDLNELEGFGAWEDLKQSNGNLTFRLKGDPGPVCQRSDVVRHLEQAAEEDGGDGLCLVSGKPDAPLNLHPSIKGVWGAQSSGANIVSFNLDAFTSWGKEQGMNAPVGKKAGFAYTTALNYLLRRGSTQRLQVGDTSTVFWAGQRTSVEADLPVWLSEPDKDNPDYQTDRIRSLYQNVKKGGFTPDEEENPFYVLGLAPNAARIAVRFWEVGTVAQISRRIVQHFDDLEIVRAPNDPPFPSLFRLLVHTATQGKADNIPPNLGGEFLRAVIGDGIYPHTLLQAAVRRNRAERKVDYYRAAMIKAFLNRLHRYNPKTSILDEEIQVALDRDLKDASYCLGRLFAVLERVQEEYNPDIKATIRATYWGAASSAPKTTFHLLLNLANKHLLGIRREKPGRATNLEKLIGEIIDNLDPRQPFPSSLETDRQGLFAVGYWHQKQHPSTYKTQGESA